MVSVRVKKHSLSYGGRLYMTGEVVSLEDMEAKDLLRRYATILERVIPSSLEKLEEREIANLPPLSLEDSIVLSTEQEDEQVGEVAELPLPNPTDSVVAPQSRRGQKKGAK